MYELRTGLYAHKFANLLRKGFITHLFSKLPLMHSTIS